MRIDANMVPPEASACMLWGGMSSCGLSTKTITAKIDSCSAVLRTCSVEVVMLGPVTDPASAFANVLSLFLFEKRKRLECHAGSTSRSR